MAQLKTSANRRALRVADNVIMQSCCFVHNSLAATVSLWLKFYNLSTVI
ncbi:hypothetical protein RNAN_0740 [Rheinheimera nanhaiensis E407-8]|uniref:Uncharacterized protein n=1 Tax=Rheinheimera nanhaiensis E407-8 TaxID=562729 RepID=I1DUP3_9GAMM|nr:hypothetical protein RNAN_0740 [Rheinheimera nanhaiensis E407-8]